MNILITGSNGFLGRHLVPLFKGHDLTLPMSYDFDLRNKEDCNLVVLNQDVVVHLAAVVGGIGYNQSNPATLFYDNAIMGINLIEAARKAHVKKVVIIGTICAYPKVTPIPFKEEELWNGYPEDTNAPYGLAKKMLLVMAQAYRKQYGMNIIYLLPVNLYGEGDNFNENSSHVIPALIRKFVEADEINAGLSGFGASGPVTIWGTGKPTREFLYVKDAAEGIYKATMKYNGSEPINLGSGMEISIKDLAYKIANIVGYKGKIIFDKSRPDGQPRRSLDVTKALKFGFKAKTPFNKGLRQTIKWYQSQL